MQDFSLYAAPAKIPEVFDLDELDSYSDQVQIKKEPSPKATASSKSSSSKTIIIPKPSPATKPRSSSSRKRKEPDSPVISDTFPYENHGFIEASGFMTSFLNQVSILDPYPAPHITYKYLLKPIHVLLLCRVSNVWFIYIKNPVGSTRHSNPS